MYTVVRMHIQCITADIYNFIEMLSGKNVPATEAKIFRKYLPAILHLTTAISSTIAIRSTYSTYVATYVYIK